MTDSEKKPGKAKSAPTAAERYHELVHTDTTGWPTEKLIEHKAKCAEALAAKRGTKF